MCVWCSEYKYKYNKNKGKNIINIFTILVFTKLCWHIDQNKGHKCVGQIKGSQSNTFTVILAKKTKDKGFEIKKFLVPTTYE